MVRSCEVQGRHVRHRTSFTELSAIDAVFEARLAAALHGCLSRLSADDKVLALPDLVIQIDGLVLGGVHLMVRKPEEDGSRMVIFRFRMVVGSVQRAFQPHMGMSEPVADLPDRCALDILCDVGLPLLDLCEASDAGLLDARTLAPEFARRIIAHAHEVRFRLELIKRFLAAEQRNLATQWPPEDLALARPRTDPPLRH
ncbi:hypothetical protein KDD17_16175 [Sulfitobacter albidus]|uniref:Uncharacterized protein n=1 Tax=Sulfitobacter albidus TaxID=2829501 RepID=A0A975PM40_9RHOB|nr:hypothetical protein [Sulfitobacter albidus]QUJ76398.1 hypothetical protein KDD17_16175 [Sulfitobacter albidus]